jgi:hypothetical protein
MIVFSQINFLAFIVAILVYFAIGEIWFSSLFGKNISGIKAEDRLMVTRMFGVTLLLNVIICFGTADMVYLVRPQGIAAIVGLALTLGVGFMAAPFALQYVSEKGSPKLALIDSGYHVVSIFVVTMILSLWR